MFGTEVHLPSFAADGASGTVACIRIEQVDAIAAPLRSIAPDRIEHGPEDRPLGQRELTVNDRENNLIGLGQSLAPLTRAGA